MQVATVDKNAHYFEFLEHLRDSGKINMFGAVPYLAKAFDLDRGEASEIFWEWTRTYGQD